jgi:hypothetical protein
LSHIPKFAPLPKGCSDGHHHSREHEPGAVYVIADAKIGRQRFRSEPFETKLWDTCAPALQWALVTRPRRNLHALQQNRFTHVSKASIAANLRRPPMSVHQPGADIAAHAAVRRNAS